MGAAVLTVGVRALVTRPADLGPAKGFPSGHVLLAGGVCGMAAVLAVRTVARVWLRVVIVTSLTLLVATIGWARVYGKYHVATDVIFATVLVAIWVYATATLTA